MRKHIKIAFIFLLLQSNHLQAQDTVYMEVAQPTVKTVFEAYDFNQEAYTLYATKWSNKVDSLGIFYIQDSSALNVLKQEWIFLESFDFYECGYDFVFYLCKANEVIEVLKLNLYCNSLVSSNGIAYQFDVNKFPFLKINTAPLEKHTFNYPNRAEAIKSLDSLALDSNIFIPKRDKLYWYSYEGNFMFDYNFDPKIKPDSDTLLLKLEVELKNLYPNEEFRIESCGGSWESYSFRVYGSEALFRKFNLYEMIMGFNKYDYFGITIYKKTTLNME